MIRAVIIDDEVNARLSLIELLSQNCPQVELIGEASGIQTGIELIKAKNPDVVLLDIQMKDGTGFNLLSQFEKPSFKIIFTTAHDQFAIKAFKHSAIDYLLKPIDPDELIEAFRKVTLSDNQNGDLDRIAFLMQSLHQTHIDRIVISTFEGLTFVKLEDIVRLESSGNYTTFFLIGQKKIITTKRIKEYEEILGKKQFVRVHQSHIVNLNYVKKIIKEDGGKIVMQNDDLLPLSRRKKEAVIALLFGQSLG